MTSTSPKQPAFGNRPRATWRTVDLVVAAVVGAALGVVFWFWGMLWAATQPLFLFFPPAQAVLYGIWLLPGVLGGLIIRKPGAAVLTSTTAAFVSMVLGTQWGVLVILSGVLQGLFPEAIFAALRYRRWGAATAVAAAVAAGLAPAILDNLWYYPTWPLTFQLAFAGIILLSSALIAGVGGRLLTTALARSGALTAFPSGRE